MGGWSAPAVVSLDVSSCWINGGDSHSNARLPVNRVRTLACFPRAALLVAPAVCLAACGGGARTVTPGDGLQGPAPSALVRATEPPAAASGTPDAPLGADSEGAGDTISSGAPTPEPSPSPQASLEGRDRQFEILNEAVSALRQEASRSYQRVSDLARDTERLRTLLASLQRRLAKSRGENRALIDHVRELEERLQEVRTPPPEAAEEARPSEPPPVSRAPVGPPSPPQSDAPGPDGGGSPTEPAGGDEAAPPAP
jgi:hypothetical protein